MRACMYVCVCMPSSTFSVSFVWFCCLFLLFGLIPLTGDGTAAHLRIGWMLIGVTRCAGLVARPVVAVLMGAGRCLLRVLTGGGVLTVTGF